MRNSYIYKEISYIYVDKYSKYRDEENPHTAVEAKKVPDPPPPAPSPESSSPTPPEPPTPPRTAVQAATTSAPPPTSLSPPTPPPWPEAYIFSTDPDRIVVENVVIATTTTHGIATALCVTEPKL
jgi:hypothetical protein